jgi:hypothetical protein
MEKRNIFYLCQEPDPVSSNVQFNSLVTLPTEVPQLPMWNGSGAIFCSCKSILKFCLTLFSPLFCFGLFFHPKAKYEMPYV